MADNNLPASLSAQWARALVQVRIARLLAYRAMKELQDGEASDATASIARLAVTQCDQLVGDLIFEVIEHRGLEDRHNKGAVLGGAAEDHWRYAQAATIASGTIEIQRIIISRALLASGEQQR